MGASADCVTGLSPALARTKGGPKMRPSLTQNLLRIQLAGSIRSRERTVLLSPPQRFECRPAEG